MPHVIAFDRITTVHLTFHDWPRSLHLPSLRHVTLTNNLVALKDFSSFPTSIRSIQILFRPFLPNYLAINWSVLLSLSTLPMLTSLHIILHDMDTGLDSTACQIIAETAPMLAHFGISFRQQRGLSLRDYVPPTEEELAAEWQADLLANPWLAQLPIVEDDDDDDRPNLKELADSYRMSVEKYVRESYIYRLTRKLWLLLKKEEEVVDCLLGCSFEMRSQWLIELMW